MQHQDLTSLRARLLWGTVDTRQQLAKQLLSAPADHTLELLVGTVRSRESWQLRGRCLEVLGMVAGEADRQLVERILELLTEDFTGRSHAEGPAAANQKAR